MKKTQKFLISIAVFCLLILPALSIAQTPPSTLVPCGGTDQPACDFNQLMNLINGLIKFVFEFLAIPICAIMFAYAGILMVTSGGSSESRGKAKNIFTNAAIGLLIAGASWLIIRTILAILGYNGDWIGFPQSGVI